ncbi:MAG: hypothetical protein M3362_25425, partial [Acidobacteriota bacterium]|nr:hypothetical protein [Acidobacteriota bacterium]
MKRILIGLLTISLALLINVMSPSFIFAQKPSAIPIDLEIPVAPTPVKAGGKIHLLYELHITNFRAKSLELMRVEVLK